MGDKYISEAKCNNEAANNHRHRPNKTRGLDEETNGILVLELRTDIREIISADTKEPTTAMYDNEESTTSGTMQ